MQSSTKKNTIKSTTST